MNQTRFCESGSLMPFDDSLRCSKPVAMDTGPAQLWNGWPRRLIAATSCLIWKYIFGLPTIHWRCASPLTPMPKGFQGTHSLAGWIRLKFWIPVRNPALAGLQTARPVAGSMIESIAIENANEAVV